MTYQVKLEIFEGPLDLLLYLVKKEELDIWDIPISRITEQYLYYLRIMQELNLDIAGEFLVMAATLMHIKSRMLLPPEETEGLKEGEVGEDPREELARQLLEYRKFKEAATVLQEREMLQMNVFTRGRVEEESQEGEESLPEANIFDLLTAFSRILEEKAGEEVTEIIDDQVTVKEKIRHILDLLRVHKRINFTRLFKDIKNRVEIVVVFLALLELIRLKEVIARQAGQFGEIRVYRNPERDY